MTLDDWLNQLEHQPVADDPELKVSRALLEQLSLCNPSAYVITVGGTNGKGSVVAILESILLAAGYAVASFSSPHLFRFNERIRINGQPCADHQIVAAFESLKPYMLEQYLGYFKHSFFAALSLFQQQPFDVILLEVGIGGHLDVTNLIDSDIAVITSIGLDHLDRLGATREQIAKQKAGIMRRAKPVIIGDHQPPQVLFDYASQLSCSCLAIDRDYSYQDLGDRWQWTLKEQHFAGLPKPVLSLDNAATALAAVSQMSLPITEDAIRLGLIRTSLPGRCQLVERAGRASVILDVAHNPAAAQRLAENVLSQPCAGKTYAVFAIMSDKDIAGVIEPLRDRVDHWFCGGLASTRAATVSQVAGFLPGVSSGFDTVEYAWQAADHQATASDRIVVFGSFYTVAGVSIC